MPVPYRVTRYPDGFKHAYDNGAPSGAGETFFWDREKEARDKDGNFRHMLSTSSLPTALYDHLAEIIRPYLGKIIFDFIWRKNVEEPPAKVVKAEEMSTDEAEGEEAIEVARAADGDEEFQRAVSPFVIVLNDSSDEMEEQPTSSGNARKTLRRRRPNPHPAPVTPPKRRKAVRKKKQPRASQGEQQRPKRRTRPRKIWWQRQAPPEPKMKVEWDCWPALAVEIQGLFIKLQLVGSDQCVWMNMGSEDLQPLGYANKHEPFRYLPPKDVADAQDWNSPADMLPFLRDLEQKIGDGIFHRCPRLFLQMRQKLRTEGSKYKVRDRVELLDTYGTDRLRVGTVKETRANRVLVELDMRYYLPNDDPNLTANDTQARLPRTGTNWVEEDSPLLFHVGWANLSNYRLLVSNSLVRGKDTYKHRARVVADAIQASQKNPDKPAVIKMMDGDARPGIVFSHCATEPVPFVPNTALELMDPNDSKSTHLTWAYIKRIVYESGHLIVKFGNDVLPVHWSSPLLFPSGYARSHGIDLVVPSNRRSIPKKNRYPDADPSLFAKVPHDDQQIKTMFPIGSLVETNSIDDPEFFFPARVTGHKGRLIEVNYWHYGKDSLALFDYRSGNIHAAGFAEFFGWHMLPRNQASDDGSDEDAEEDEQDENQPDGRRRQEIKRNSARRKVVKEEPLDE